MVLLESSKQHLTLSRSFKTFFGGNSEKIVRLPKLVSDAIWTLFNLGFSLSVFFKISYNNRCCIELGVPASGF